MWTDGRADGVGVVFDAASEVCADVVACGFVGVALDVHYGLGENDGLVRSCVCCVEDSAFARPFGDGRLQRVWANTRQRVGSFN